MSGLPRRGTEPARPGWQTDPVDDDPTDGAGRPTRREISGQVGPAGWRYVLAALVTHVPVQSLAAAVRVGGRAVSGCGGHADDHLRLDLRADRVVITLQDRTAGAVTSTDVECALRVTAALGAEGLTLAPDVGSATGRSAQILEIALDALDIPSVRPFWKAVLGYVDEAGSTDPEAALIDPLGQGPALWFQQLDAPRPQRNRIHLDVSVPHDEAAARIRAALAAGGTLRSDAEAPAFWVLADAEGNEVCVTTWEGRDAVPPSDREPETSAS